MSSEPAAKALDMRATVGARTDTEIRVVNPISGSISIVVGI